MNRSYWILVDKVPVPTDDLYAWADWLKNANRNLRRNAYQCHGKRFWISTVFLPLDYNFTDEGPPILFETMVFEDHSYVGVMGERWSSYDEALAGHEMLYNRAKVEYLGIKKSLSGHYKRKP